MTERVDERPSAPPANHDAPGAGASPSGHSVDGATAGAGAAVSRRDLAERRRRARRTSAARVGALVAALLVVLVTAAAAVGYLVRPGDARTPTSAAPAGAKASGAAAPSSAAGAPATSSSSTGGQPTAGSGPATDSRARSAPSPAPSANAPSAAPSGAPTVPVALTATQPQARAAQLLAVFDRLASQAAPGALVATARLGEDVAPTPTGLVGEWGSGRAANGWTVAANGDAALRAGKIVAASPLSSTTGTATIRVGDAARSVPIVSAAQALRQAQLGRFGACGRCAPLVVTSARGSSAQVPTTAGVVRVPAWEFSLAGTTARLVRPAVSPAALIQVAPAYRPAVPAAIAATTLPLWKVAVGDDPRVITAVVDRREIKARPGCWRLYAVEGRSGVALYAAAGAADATAPCATPAGRVSVRLGSPLGSRTLLDSYWQRALPLRD